MSSEHKSSKSALRTELDDEHHSDDDQARNASFLTSVDPCSFPLHVVKGEDIGLNEEIPCERFPAQELLLRLSQMEIKFDHLQARMEQTLHVERPQLPPEWPLAVDKKLDELLQRFSLKHHEAMRRDLSTNHDTDR